MALRDKRLADITDPVFCEMVKRVAPYSMHANNGDIENLYAWYRDIRYVLTHNIPGAIVECGVWRGGMLMLAGLVCQDVGEYRDLWGYDTFKGVPAPSAHDEAAVRSTYQYWQAQGQRWGYGGTRAEVLDAFQRVVRWYNAPFVLMAGRVEERLPVYAPAHIAALRIDVDLYEGTLHCLEHLYPRLAVGGILVLDDYGLYQGARKAADEYIAKNDIRLHLTRVGPSVYEAVKQYA